MRRLLAIACLVLAAGLLVAWPATGDDGGPYRVRAIFDNAGFVVAGEEVRIAGAKVGQVESVDVTMADETASIEGGPHAIPGKAVVVMKIDDPGFRDFRSDASCLIRPQSLIGEKYVECTPTQPHAAGTEPPPPLAEVPSGEPGEGQHLLPVEQNGKAVDLDLVQNVMRRPYADRFRLILNELGAGLAARGDDLGQIIERADPALRQTDRVLAILAEQNKQLATLAQNSDTILQPLADQRTHITGFFRNANTTNAAVLERRGDFEAGLQALPAGLDELQRTMSSLTELTDQGTPLFTSLNEAAPNLSKATQKLGPFAETAIPAVKTLGDAGQTAGPKLVAADPVVVQIRDLANSSTPVAKNLSSLLDTFSKTKGFNYLTDFIYNTVGSINGFDTFGHFLRASLQVTSCLDYQTAPFSGCGATFTKVKSTDKCQQKNKKKRKRCQQKRKKKKKGKAAAISGAALVDATGDVRRQAAHVPTSAGQVTDMLDFLFGNGDQGNADQQPAPEQDTTTGTTTTGEEGK